ncbi:hypothetical protein [Asticcacaulis sp. AND118]|uniref:Y-family DNA polymerase n=1 Tax=Asticcacaulis sp. AND118 TaxID=2840468 RepID=UPI0021042BE2|nr:hypothetical protein [Asticcacaulis sp. AND118]
MVLKGSDGRRRVVTAADDFARSLGIAVGMPIAKAQALVNDLHILDANPDADLDGLGRLIRIN